MRRNEADCSNFTPLASRRSLPPIVKWVHQPITLLVFAITGACAAPSGQLPPPGSPTADLSAEDTPSIAAVREVELAWSLARWSRKTESPHGLLMAARIYTHAMRPMAQGMETTEFRADAAETRKILDRTIGGWIAEAREMAEGDPDLLLQADALVSSAAKGVAPGPLTNRQWEIPAKAKVILRFSAKGSEPLRVWATSDGDAPIELQLLEESGRLACREWRGRIEALCQITPSFDTRYVAKIVNHGQVRTRVFLVSN